MWIDDEMLVRCHEPVALSVWVPEQPLVVLGSSNQPHAEVNVESCTRDGIPILKRYGGGGTVLLYDGCVVVSLGLWVQQLYQNKLYFERINQAVIDALAWLWPELSGLSQRGLSDITFGEHKVGGTSLFRSRNYLLYQASLLVDLNPSLIDQYLKHPSREPDYRNGRSHKDFLTGLSTIAEGLNTDQCVQQFCAVLPRFIDSHLKDDLILPITEQFPALYARVQRSKETNSNMTHVG